MIALTAALLVGLLRITVEYSAQDLSCVRIDFDRGRISEFSAPVCEYDLKY